MNIDRGLVDNDNNVIQITISEYSFP